MNVPGIYTPGTFNNSKGSSTTMTILSPPTSSTRIVPARSNLRIILNAWGLTGDLTNDLIGDLTDDLTDLIDGVTDNSPEPIRPAPAPVAGFSVWLAGQENRSGPVGGLAWEMNRDGAWPGDVPVLELFDHLTHEGAPPDVLAALHSAWAEWATRRTA